jgi:hypothetical protein
MESVKLFGSGGHWVSLSPDSYQYPKLESSKWNGWDENWLLISGEISYEGGRWAFRDPCLTAGEALAVAPWLRAAAAGTVPVSENDSAGGVSPDLVFVEPNIAFSVGGRDGGSVRLRVHFSLESAPPEFTMDERADIWQFFIELDMSGDALEAAASQWDQQIQSLPVREAS